MIYSGYQGIGKSTLARKMPNVIDLESGNFFVNGQRHEDWYKVYANIAKHLSEQGKIVFVSSHSILRDYMKESKIPYKVIFPSLNLKSEWTAKLKQRYEETKKSKDFKAWVNAVECYDRNITALYYERDKIMIESMEYSLENLI